MDVFSETLEALKRIERSIDRLVRVLAPTKPATRVKMTIKKLNNGQVRGQSMDRLEAGEKYRCFAVYTTDDGVEVPIDGAIKWAKSWDEGLELEIGEGFCDFVA